MKKIIIFLILMTSFFGSCENEKKWYVDKNGLIKVIPIEIPEELKNPEWPIEWEKEFWERSNYVIKKVAKPGNYGNTYFENEKRSYGWAMLSILAGYEKEGLRFLQEEDAQANSWNKHTKGIDFYACFTLKHQMRKYFFFGDYLEPEYKKRMYEGAKIWTEEDPLWKPHPFFNPERAKIVEEEGIEDWTPETKNSWVDIRDTDNLKLMRDCAVYLFAEETGNEKTRKIYKEKIFQFIYTMFLYGMGEWDSENYLGHSFSPLLCLYDFAKDKEVKSWAKAGLDWMSISASIKYWKGCSNGPTKRDYNHPYPYGGSLASLFWLYFGDTKFEKEEFESDEIHVITSAYRPPIPVIHLAHKNFKKPVEIISCKPPYHVWKMKDVKPENFEINYFGKTFQLGSLIKGTQNRDINGFKMLFYSSKNGVNYFLSGPVKDPFYLGSPQYKEGILKGESRIAHYKNILIYLTKDSDIPFLWSFPDEVSIEKYNDILFLKGEKTWIAILPVGIEIKGIDEPLTEKMKKNKKLEKMVVISSNIISNKFYGFCMEVGEEDEYKDFSDFKNLIIGKVKLVKDIQKGIVDYISPKGKRLKLIFENGSGKTEIWRDGEIFDYENEDFIYRSLDSDLIYQKWGEGKIRIKCGGWEYECSIKADGKVNFTNKEIKKGGGL
jgi:hypothetical protein